MFKDNILHEIGSCSDPLCINAIEKTNNLTINVNYSIVDVETASTAVESAQAKDFNASVVKMGAELDKISDAIETSTTDAIKDAETQADGVGNDISNFIKDLDTGVDGTYSMHTKIYAV